MRVIHLDSLEHPGLADYRGLTDATLRLRSEPDGGLYIAESGKVIERALLAGHHPRSVLVPPQWVESLRPLLADVDVDVFVGESALLESLTGFNLHRGALAAMHRPQLPEPAALLHDARRVVILEDIVDHTNVGAIFRSVAGLGADAVFITPRCADPLYRRSVRVSMGTVLQVPWTRVPEWPETSAMLRDTGFTVAALALSDGAVTLDDFAAAEHDRVALVLGAEGDGLSHTALEHAHAVVTIPMSAGVDSLNVAAASAVALWALRPGKRVGDREPNGMTRPLPTR